MVLYRDVTPKILVNGHLSKSLHIERGVKQGDAFSNGIFNICIDPLIRNIIMSRERMFRFGMSRNDNCERCGAVETYVHLFWGCAESRMGWSG